MLITDSNPFVLSLSKLKWCLSWFLRQSSLIIVMNECVKMCTGFCFWIPVNLGDLIYLHITGAFFKLLVVVIVIIYAAVVIIVILFLLLFLHMHQTGIRQLCAFSSKLQTDWTGVRQLLFTLSSKTWTNWTGIRQMSCAFSSEVQTDWIGIKQISYTFGSKIQVDWTGIEGGRELLCK